MASVGFLLILTIEPAAIQVHANPTPNCRLGPRLRSALERLLPGLEVLPESSVVATDDLILSVSRRKKRLHLHLANVAGQ